MTPRAASLRTAHQKHCPHANKTSLDSLQKVKGCTCSQPDWPEDKPKPKTVAKCSGCKCEPSYYVMWRDTSGGTRKGPRVKSLREAKKALRVKQVEIDQGRTGAE